MEIERHWSGKDSLWKSVDLYYNTDTNLVNVVASETEVVEDRFISFIVTLKELDDLIGMLVGFRHTALKLSQSANKNWTG